MSYLVIVRHGETELNVYNRQNKHNQIFNGQAETPLTANGLEQAVVVGTKIAADIRLNIQSAFSSDIKRGVHSTAAILSQLPRPLNRVVLTRGLRERYAGIFEGRSEQEVFVEFPKYKVDPNFNQFRSHFEQHAPEGENYADVTERVWAAVQQAESAEPGDILIVSHMHAIRCLVGKALGLSQGQILSLKIPNASPIIVERGNPYVLIEGLLISAE